jgi:hypothetical protein
MTARTHRVETAGTHGGQCRGHDQKPLPTPCLLMLASAHAQRLCEGRFGGAKRHLFANQGLRETELFLLYAPKLQEPELREQQRRGS